MTRTRPLTLIVFAVAGGLAIWLIEVALVTGGYPVAIPPVSLALVLAVIGLLDVALAIPIRRAVRRRGSIRVDPFYATRVVVLAKASAIAGSLLAGVALGIVIFLLTRVVMPGVGSIVLAGATAVAAIVLLAGGLVAEFLCSVPPDDDDKREETSLATHPH